MDMWTDFNLNIEWGLDLLAQPDGLFGDLKETSRQCGDMDPAQKPRDAVKQLVYSPDTEGSLDIEWMESGDLGSLLDALDNNVQDKVLSLDDDLFGCSQEYDLKNNFSPAKSMMPSVLSSEVEDYIQGLTPPDSPEQVIPVIKLDPDLNSSNWTGDLSNVTPNFLVTSLEVNTPSELSPDYKGPDYLLEDQLEATPVFESDILSLSLTANDIVSDPEQVELKLESDISEVVSLSGNSDDSIYSPEASPRPSIESIIQSSPELYKVIATPSLAGFSPYSKTKGEVKSKSESKTVKPGKEKQLERPIPEEFISNHLGKRERKKLQNKNAAIRYRQKKKMEGQCLVGEVQDLEDKNQDLKTKVDDLQREIKYMKNLMEEIYKAKGILK